jgi:hypothetical protein
MRGQSRADRQRPVNAARGSTRSSTASAASRRSTGGSARPRAQTLRWFDVADVDPGPGVAARDAWQRGLAMALATRRQPTVTPIDRPTPRM